ncbi:FAD-dependent oxidoreductase [Cohnella panacarvi]|uniref:FAD-dependent oxidoreductase n=1 Tax=Cohnella panacarvi TaxID=400776 RepID=UPI00047CF2D7|nr:FAD-dependent oxidoreductase [Cohnella panacarvi]
MAQLPQFPESYWTTSVDIPSFPELSSDLSADVVIVGAGITGITAGYLLSKQGVKVAILEAGRILHGTTGHTTAKITVQHDVIYDELIGHFGEEQARLYYEANRDALQFMKRTVETENIACDYAIEDAVLYAQTFESADKLEKELRAYEKLGIPGELKDSIDLPLKITSALAVKEQARFHPIPYLTTLIDRITNAGSHVFEHTTVMKVEDGASPVVVTEKGQRLTCKHVLSASHFPFLDWKGMYFARLHAERSYVLAVKIKQPYGGGMYLSIDKPSRSIRLAQDGDEPLILIGGEGHKAGQSPCTIKHYEALQTFAATTFDVKEIAYRWSTQDLVTTDKVPYVGRINADNPNILVATGYRKWGMTNSTAAAHMLTNIVLGNEDRYLKLYDPARFHADPDLRTIISQNANVAKELISGKLETTHRSVDEVLENEGAVVNIGGKKAGAYRDPNGVLHVVDTTCTHMGCETHWNDGDRTWDCPCHGSRYSYTGEVIEGPAKEPLAKIEV